MDLEIKIVRETEAGKTVDGQKSVYLINSMILQDTSRVKENIKQIVDSLGGLDN